MKKAAVSSSMEDYLKAIFELGESKVKTQDLAAELDVSSASVTGMIKKLSELKLIDYERYYGVSLTKAGRLIALETLRHHRLLETYLAQALGYAWHEVHAEAEHLEHHISEAFEEKIAHLLGHPNYDPHGDPIPQRDGTVPQSLGRPLPEFNVGEKLIITRVKGKEAELLKYLAEHKLVPNSNLAIKTKAPFDGPITVTCEGSSVALAFAVAERLEVEKASVLDKLKQAV